MSRFKIFLYLPQQLLLYSLHFLNLVNKHLMLILVCPDISTGSTFASLLSLPLAMAISKYLHQQEKLHSFSGHFLQCQQ